MKKILQTEFLLVCLVISYVFIAVRGEHLGGPLGLFIFLNLFNDIDWINGVFPLVGLVLLIVCIFYKKRKIIYIISLFLLYPCLVAYAIHQISKRNSVDEVTSILSMLPFLALSIFILFKKTEGAKSS